jgi:ribonuclease-3
MSSSSVDAIERTIGYRFKDADLIQKALTHASTVDVRLESNERLEFLGDAVLGMIVCEAIFEKFPGLLEGEMTKIKSSAVSRHACAQMAKSLGIEKHLKIGKGMQSAAELPSSLGAALLEAIIAAVYIDGGFAAVKGFVRPLVEPLIDQAADSGHQQNFKSLLQQHVQQEMASTPCYRVLDEKGPDHAKCFKVAVEISGRRFTPSWGQSKKRAEQSAALLALCELGVLVENEDGRLRMSSGVAVDVSVLKDAVGK